MSLSVSNFILSVWSNLCEKGAKNDTIFQYWSPQAFSTMHYADNLTTDENFNLNSMRLEEEYKDSTGFYESKRSNGDIEFDAFFSFRGCVFEEVNFCTWKGGLIQSAEKKVRKRENLEPFLFRYHS